MYLTYARGLKPQLTQIACQKLVKEYQWVGQNIDDNKQYQKQRLFGTFSNVKREKWFIYSGLFIQSMTTI
jgi:hypothetical protein